MHVIFAFVDHWEPGEGPSAAQTASLWYDQYGQMASVHHDADGRAPQHTWFCHSLDLTALRIIAKCAFAGLGEMEIHIHHGTGNDDGHDNTSEMSTLIDQYLVTLKRVGACLTAEGTPRTAWGFVHGLWALDNSRYIEGHHRYCGVNREIDLLLAKKCFGDFTFPAWGTMTPRTFTSTIFASRDTPSPKSYDDPFAIRQVTAHGQPLQENELLIFPGPGPDAAISNIDAGSPATLARMREWLSYYVHIPGREDWVFVKAYTHGAANLSSAQGISNLVGSGADAFYSELETYYNDGHDFILHYVTARELFNIVAAAAAGHTGNPNDFRDYAIPPPVNSRFFCEADYSLITFTAGLPSAVLRVEAAPGPLVLWAKDFDDSALVNESNSESDLYSPSDSQLTSTAAIPLVITDPTPSLYYSIHAP